MNSRPFRFASLLLCSLLMFVVSLHAGDLKYPVSGPHVTLTVPDSWKVTKSKGNLVLAPPTGNVTITVSADLAKTSIAYGDGAKAYATKMGMTDISVEDSIDITEPSWAIVRGNLAGVRHVLHIREHHPSDHGLRVVSILSIDDSDIKRGKELGEIAMAVDSIR